MTGKKQLEYNKNTACWEQMDCCKMSDENDSDSDEHYVVLLYGKGMGRNGEQSCDEHRKY